MQGNEYIWHEQIKKYNVTGYHLFAGGQQYEQLYKESTNDSMILMPHYLILDKTEMAEANAKQPSDGDSLYAQLSKYLETALKVAIYAASVLLIGFVYPAIDVLPKAA